MRRVFLVLLMTTVVVSFGFAAGEGEAGDAEGETIELVMASSQPPGGGYVGDLFEKFEEYLAEESGGQIELTVHHSGALSANERELLEMAQSGSVDVAMGATTYVLGWSNSFKVFDLPYLFDDVDHFADVVFGEVGQQMADELADDGVILLGQIIPGFRSVFTAGKTIETFEDLEGLKIRSMQSPVYVNMFKRLGMLPTAMPASELYTALETGVVDAGENDPASVVSWGWIDVIDYYMMDRHTLSSNVLVMNKDRFDSLSPDMQEAVRTAAERAIRYQFDYIQGAWEESMEMIREKGITVVELPQSELDKFREAVEPVIAEYEDEIGPDLIEKVKAAR